MRVKNSMKPSERINKEFPSERINKEFPIRRITGMYAHSSDLEVMLDLILEELDELSEQLNNIKRLETKPTPAED